MPENDEPIQLAATLDLPTDPTTAEEAESAPEPTPEATPEAGAQLGRFQVLGEVGRGGMGTVLRARDPELRRTVAVKVSSRSVSKQRLGRFVAEAQITAQLEHPNIVPVYDLGVSEAGELFYAMKLVGGTDLAALLARSVGDRDGWTLHRLIQAFAQICRAVAFAHERGILHRDLKPANIMLGPLGEVLVLDWGLARAVGSEADIIEQLPEGIVDGLFSAETGKVPVVSTASLSGSRSGSSDVERVRVSQTEDGSVLGTPGYMSPEQGRGELDRVGPASDIFALGAILFEILTDGDHAFPGENAVERLSASLRPAPDPRDSASVPGELAEACLHALAAEPDDRPATALELADRMDSWLEGRRARSQAEDLLAQAGLARTESIEARDQALSLRSEAEAELGTVLPGAPEEQKLSAWTRLEEAERLLSEAAVAEVRFERLSQTALEHCSELDAAHETLADHYRERHEEAEAARNQGDAARFEVLLRSHDRGEHAGYLEGIGTLEFDTKPSGAHVTVRAEELRGRRLRAGEARDLGATPVKVELPAGSYIATLQSEGHEPVRYPLEITREGTWKSDRPGARRGSPVPLPAAGSLGPDDVYVPGGWSPTGGDASGAGSFPARRIWIDGFVIRRFPVTWGEYVAFLNDVDPADAATWQPRETASSPDQPGAALLSPDDEGYTLGERVADWPVTNIDWGSAMAYCDWAAARDGVAWRLPCELEWEKAARGVDERYFPWGYTDDPSWRLTLESHLGPPSPEPVTGHPADCSPYGVRGLAGGVRDWILDPFLPGGPPVTADGRLVISAARDAALPHGTRGGAWSLPDWVGRACVRGYHPPIHLADLGFRMARVI